MQRGKRFREYPAAHFIRRKGEGRTHRSAPRDQRSGWDMLSGFSLPGSAPGGFRKSGLIQRQSYAIIQIVIFLFTGQPSAKWNYLLEPKGRRFPFILLREAPKSKGAQSYGTAKACRADSNHPGVGGPRGLVCGRLRPGRPSQPDAGGLGHHHLRPAGGNAVAIRPPGGTHGPAPRHRHRQNRGRPGGGHHLPDRRDLPGPPPPGERRLHPLRRRGPGPPGLHRQRHRPESPGRAPGPLRRAGRSPRRHSPLRGRPGPAVSGGRPPDSPGPSVRGGAGLFHRA